MAPVTALGETPLPVLGTAAQLPELLREVQKGKRFTITHRGKPVADLVPSESRKAKMPPKLSAHPVAIALNG